MTGQHQEPSAHLPTRKRALAFAISTIVGGGTQSAAAQDALEEIVVTASRRASNLQDLPVAVTAFSTDQIQKKRLAELDDYAKFVPGLSFARREPAGASIVFRGVASAGLQFGGIPSSAVYLDEQPLTAGGFNPDPRLVDIERLEALSGPQGTLFGASSQSGTLRIITNKPDATEFDSWIDVTGSKVDKGDLGYDVSAMVNVPIIENELAMRFVGFRAEEAGFIDNVLGTSQGGTFNNANLVEDDVNSQTTTGGRAAVRWTPNDTWTVDVTAIYQELENDAFADVNLDVGDLEQVRFNDESAKDEWYQFALNIEGKLGIVDTVLSVSYYKREFEYNADAADYNFNLNQGYINYGYVSYAFGGDPRSFAFLGSEDKRLSIEGRLSTPSDSDSRWHGIVGFFYNKTEEDAIFTAAQDDFLSTAAFAYFNYLEYYYTGAFIQNPTTVGFLGLYDDTEKQTSIFGEITFDFTENLSITAGGRWFKFDQQINRRQEQPQGITAGGFFFNDAMVSTQETGFVPKVNVTYQINDDKMVYMTYSQGFRVGGVNGLKPGSNPQVLALFSGYDSDKLKNLEWGAKTTWLDGRLRINATAYVMKWDDIIVQVEDPSPFFQVFFTNFPQAEIKGIEADFAWVPAEGWNVYGSASYNDAAISSDATFGNPVVVSASEGTRLPIAPKWKGALGAEYSFQKEIFGATPYINFDLAYQGKSINSLNGIEAAISATPPTIQDAYTVGDLKIGLEGEQWSASVFIDNVWDERGAGFYSNRWAKQRLSVNQPRTFGINFRRSFK
ncbi:MAG: TonB-dependent receptor [Gammaproteobacteria bacterium]|nr:TonB-dependent receptor [Gammaproteobacteria bacterium]